MPGLRMQKENFPANHASREVMPDEYWPLASDYLRNGRRNEEWSINRIDWDGEILRASCRLEGYAVSKTDQNRFHLSIFAAREMEAQLAIIAIHLKLGLKRKTTEVWVLECAEKCIRAITTPTDVRFEIQLETERTSSGKSIATCQSRIWDAPGGEITLRIKRLMALPQQTAD